MQSPIALQITTSDTTTAIGETRYLTQLVIGCDNAGSSWTLSIQDKSTPAKVLIPTFTLAVPSDGNPNVLLNFKESILMSGGIDIVTAGTPGVVSVWLSFA